MTYLLEKFIYSHTANSSIGLLRQKLTVEDTTRTEVIMKLMNNRQEILPVFNIKNSTLDTVPY